jgi:divalent metal cation (Fe/Co/Zn/Cd) transporter
MEYATIAVASAEAAGALISGVVAGSVALEAFGVDSLIEIISAVIVLGELRVLASGSTPDPGRRHRDHRVLALLFFALIAYVLTSVVVALVRRHHAVENAFGVVVCIASLLAMTALATMKRSAAAKLEGGEFGRVARLVKADAGETMICGMLSLSTLIGVVLAGSLGWWWADPVASLAVVVIAAREGREAWHCEAL